MSPSAVSVVFGISLEAWISDLRSASCHWSIFSKNLKFLKHKAVLLDVQCLSINTESHSLRPPLWLRTAETTVRKGRRKQKKTLPLLFSYHIQPCTIIFSISTWAWEAHESLPWSCNLSCNRLIEDGSAGAALCTGHPSGHRSNPVQTVPYYSNTVTGCLH